MQRAPGLVADSEKGPSKKRPIKGKDHWQEEEALEHARRQKASGRSVVACAVQPSVQKRVLAPSPDNEVKKNRAEKRQHSNSKDEAEGVPERVDNLMTR